MYNDLTLDLPNEQGFGTLTIVAEPDRYCETLQRVICLVFLTKYQDIEINGVPLYVLLRQANSSTVSALNTKLGILADEIKKDLNNDDGAISELKIYANADNNNITINFDIVTADGVKTTEEIKL